MRCRAYLFPVVLCLTSFATAGAVFSQEKKEPAYADPAKTDADFPYQGEYSGDIDGGNRFGVQVIALGKGKFHAVAYPGGLPGDGWNRLEKIDVDGTLQNGKLEFKGNDGSGVITEAGKMQIYNSDGGYVGDLKKVERQSPTLGQKPPEGAVVLFDGKSADEFEGGRVEDGLLLEGVTSKRKFGSCTIHLEFRLPYMPESRGQGRGNSGLYVDGRFEVQLLDSFGLEGKDNECGGLYSLKAPDVNMCYPPLTWQTYDIDYTAPVFDGGTKTKNAVLTVKHNGVTIHDKVELSKLTPGNMLPDDGTKGPIHLQNHGNPVRFRNIWVLEK
jgi:hypothetical protein